MPRISRMVLVGSSALLAAVLAVQAGAEGSAPVSPIYGVALPKGYRSWELIAPAQEAPPLDELRTTLGNPTAMKAYRAGTQPFPDGTVLVKLAWKHVQSPEFAPASIPGAATTVQVMVKDSKRYAATGGWGFGRFVNGQPVDAAQHQTCWSCHQSRAAGHDFVFTRYAP
ncbi:cytochrome P460 [Novosphingobium sp. PhB165]|uniref:cytochrome P460 family protein n=1 Tax=Novosphingobium sp. PhB165 TaxID=2485105 RepID=UPI0010529D00|nr:cytochrome P460 family protein [Novosphingobium sp. PhB165]TCM20607.1 cytochrome P460 [Novosphingobium sp. PhB165]